MLRDTDPVMLGVGLDEGVRDSEDETDTELVRLVDGVTLGVGVAEELSLMLGVTELVSDMLEVGVLDGVTDEVEDSLLLGVTDGVGVEVDDSLVELVTEGVLVMDAVTLVLEVGDAL